MKRLPFIHLVEKMVDAHCCVGDLNHCWIVLGLRLVPCMFVGGGFLSTWTQHSSICRNFWKHYYTGSNTINSSVSFCNSANIRAGSSIKPQISSATNAACAENVCRPNTGLQSGINSKTFTVGRRKITLFFYTSHLQVLQGMFVQKLAHILEELTA